MKEHGFDLGLAVAVAGGDLPDALREEVAAQEYLAGCLLFGAEKIIQEPPELGVVGGRDALVGEDGFDLGEQDDLVCIPLPSVIIGQAFEGKIARDAADKGFEIGRSGGRDGVPQAEVGVTHALLGVTLIPEDVAGNSAAELAVFFVGFADGLLVPLPIETDDPVVVHHALFPPFREIGFLT